MLIFGYTWDEIQAAQRGKPLGTVVNPRTNKNCPCTQDDVDLLIKYGPQKLRDLGYYGVIDRLQRAELM